jgi:DNA mismatch endonuclease, patch repair protein
MTPAQRSAFMSSIRPRNNGIERRVFQTLRRAGLRFRCHEQILPRCSPDLVVKRTRAVVLIHGDFWHGWRYPAWRHKLAPFWKEKLSINRAWDARNCRALRRAGWRVMRVWEHDLERDFDGTIQEILSFARTATAR